MFWIYLLLAVQFTSTAGTASDVVTELRKNKLTEHLLYSSMQGITATDTFYENVQETYEQAELSRPLCQYLLNMHLAFSLFEDKKLEAEINKITSNEKAIKFAVKNSLPMDLRYIGVIDPIEIYKKQIFDVRDRDWIDLYMENAESIKTCLSWSFNTKDRSILYDVTNLRNTYLELYYMYLLLLSEFRLSEAASIYTYNIPSAPSTFMNKEIPDEVKTAINELKQYGIKAISSGGQYEAAVDCYNLTDVSMADTNHSKDMTEISCKPRLLREECTDTSYMLNRSIVQSMTYHKKLKIIKLYEIQAYNYHGGKLKIKQAKTLQGKETSGWDYHVASLVIIQNLKDKNLYIVVNDNFFSENAMTIQEWTTLFSNSQKIKYRLIPFIRSKKREELYMTFDEANKKAASKKRVPNRKY